MYDRRRTNDRGTGYVSGTAARKLGDSYSGSGRNIQSNLALQEQPHRQEERIVRRAPQQRVKIVKRENSFGFGAMLLLTMAAIMTGVVCISYLSAQSEIKTTKKEISALAVEIEDMKNNNTLAREQIEDSVSLRKVYRVATKELGMIHPEKNQVISFENVKSSVVRQYGEIPKQDKGVIGNVLENNKK